MPLTVLDLVVIAIVVLSAVLSLSRGLVRETLTLLAWIGAFAVAWFAFAPVRPAVADAVPHDLAADLITAALVFLVPLVVFKIIAGMVAKSVDGSGLSLFDKLLGLGFGVARGALIVSLAYLIGTMLITPENEPTWMRNAYLRPQLVAGANLVREFLPPEFEVRTLGVGEQQDGEPDGGANLDPVDWNVMDGLIQHSTQRD
jgi:membrane protein required for colicin V production